MRSELRAAVWGLKSLRGLCCDCHWNDQLLDRCRLCLPPFVVSTDTCIKDYSNFHKCGAKVKLLCPTKYDFTCILPLIIYTAEASYSKCLWNIRRNTFLLLWSDHASTGVDSHTLPEEQDVKKNCRNMKRKEESREKTGGLKVKQSFISVWESSERFPVPQRAPDSHTTHWGAGLCGKRTAIVTAITGQAAIVQLPLWDWLRHAGPPYDLNRHTHTHTLQDISNMLSHGDFIPKPSADVGGSHLTRWAYVQLS